MTFRELSAVTWLLTTIPERSKDPFSLRLRVTSGSISPSRRYFEDQQLKIFWSLVSRWKLQVLCLFLYSYGRDCCGKSGLSVLVLAKNDIPGFLKPPIYIGLFIFKEFYEHSLPTTCLAGKNYSHFMAEVEMKWLVGGHTGDWRSGEQGTLQMPFVNKSAFRSLSCPCSPDPQMNDNNNLKAEHALK